MSSIWVQRVSKTVLAAVCGLAFTLASGCCSHCHKPCCKDKDKDAPMKQDKDMKGDKH
ncbi:MAG: hypothetical protein HY287_01325 [Planctomycetes bacterium]|nr:hypothetical protein [Planctomycetota bacterium]MBI3832948.1 hypothetical protein [Planctomycetota bacterium]